MSVYYIYHNQKQNDIIEISLLLKSNIESDDIKSITRSIHYVLTNALGESTNEETFKYEFSKEELLQLANALDIYMRVLLGQLHHLTYACEIPGIDKELISLKSEFFPNSQAYESISLISGDGPENAKVAFDMRYTIMNYFSDKKNPLSVYSELPDLLSKENRIEISTCSFT